MKITIYNADECQLVNDSKELDVSLSLLKDENEKEHIEQDNSQNFADIEL